jgi:hypothetical protein
MEPFERVAALVEERWQKSGDDPARFPSLAAEVLRESALHDQVTFTDVLAHHLHADSPPPQRPFDPDWGHPAITICARRAIFIEVVFWLDGTTAVHQHAFSGAFQLIEGSSLESRYGFAESERIAPRLRVGRLERESIELLSVGEVREIAAGQGLIHSLFHLDRPSVTVVLRTYQEAGALPQWSYLPPGLAVDPALISESARLVQSLELLRATRPLDHAARVSELLQRLDGSGAFIVLQHCRRVMGEGGRLDGIYRRAREKHGSWIDQLPAVFDEQQRQELLLAQRREVTDPDRRFFLALSLASLDEPARRALILKRYPGADPEALSARFGAPR